ncbi:MAG: hypothetical protein LBL18_01860, partial [Bacteroidales bacterium]|nr:hypothetical protein [Bacteroidales bacterium]
KLQRTCYWSKYGGWQNPETMEVELSSTSSAAEKENFRLEDHLWSFADNVKYEVFSKVLTDAFATKDTPDKFSYRYIQRVNIDSEGYSVSINAKLASNDQKVNEYYDYDFNGKLLK